MKSPIFIFSLPRSGSTLLQRLFLSHKSIGGTEEPWLLLPLVYALKEKGTLSEYSNVLSQKAITDAFGAIPNGKAIYYQELNTMVSNIYAKFLKHEEVYFLDKTPRYYYIIDDIVKIFPEAKFIFLFRNPVQIYASILTTWCKNNFLNLFGSHNDLEFGFQKLSEGYRKHKHNKNTYGLNYEDLIKDPKKILRHLQTFLDIEYDDALEVNFINAKINTEHKLGDPTGIKKYKTISTETLEKWKHTFNTKTRKLILKRYIIKNLTQEDLEIQNFDKIEILKEIDALDNRGKHNFIKDIFCYSGYKLIVRFNLYLIFSKTTAWIKNNFMS